MVKASVIVINFHGNTEQRRCKLVGSKCIGYSSTYLSEWQNVLLQNDVLRIVFPLGEIPLRQEGFQIHSGNSYFGRRRERFDETKETKVRPINLNGIVVGKRRRMDGIPKLWYFDNRKLEIW